MRRWFHQKTAGIAFAWVVLIGLPTLSAQDQSVKDHPSEATRLTKPSEPLPNLSDAEEWLTHGDYAAARDAFETLARSKNPTRRTKIGLARTHLRVGEYEAAQNLLKQLPGPKTTAQLLLLSQVNRTRGAYDAALAQAEAAIKLDDDNAEARLARAELLETLGRRDEAIAAYHWFDRQLVLRSDLPRDAVWLTAAAEGFLRYSILTQTNVRRRTRHALQEMLQMAYGVVDRTYWPARIVAADLLRERFNNNEDHGSISDYQAALRINKNLPEALVGLGEVALTRWGFEEIEARAEKALEINPNYAPAMHLLGKKLVLERRYHQAIIECERALTINPNDITALAISAGASACLFDNARVASLLARIKIINPRSAMAYRILGDALGGIRQYEASEQAYLQAIEFEPTDANARTELGMMYMQWGLEGKARNALDAGWALDPYNERTKNTLDLLEQLEQFSRVNTEHFVVAYDETRDPGLGEYVAGYLEDIYDEVTSDYGTELSHNTVIELFPTHRAFGVRITGKPWIHTVGACTGRVIAMETPRDSVDLMGPYNLLHVLKHEFTHTVTLAATKNRIPHWFTEGLAVYQEDTPRSYDWVQLLVAAARRSEWFTLASIDWGFMRPKRPTDRTRAYAQSEWMVEYIVGRWGYDVIDRMLKRYRGGEKQPQVIQEEFGLTFAEFDQAFHAWAKDQINTWGFDLTPPEEVAVVRAELEKDDQNLGILGRLAQALFDAEDFQKAFDVSRQTLELDASQPVALEVLVRVTASLARQESDPEIRRAYEAEATPALDRLLKIAPNNEYALRYGAQIALRHEEHKRAEKLLTQLQSVRPMDPTSWNGLAGIYLDREENDRAIPQLLELTRLVSDDHEIRAELGRLYRRSGRLRDAQYWYRQALAINPFDVDYHEAYGDVCMQAGDARTALAEYRWLTKFEPDVADHFAKAAFAAKRLGDKEQMRTFAEKAAALDPKSPAKALLD